MAKSCKILTVVGARPQFIKAAAVSRAFATYNRLQGRRIIEELIVHTGQHYDTNMSKVFFDELDIPKPAVNLEVGSGTHGRQTAAMLERLEGIMMDTRPDWVLIYGDTNSTLAGSLAAAKLHIPIAHVEAGLRSYRRGMPEEVNRVVADRLSTMLLCPTQIAVDNLRKEGVTEGVHLVGDVMYDSVLVNAAKACQKSDVIARLSLEPKSFYLVTIHRAENTDAPERLKSIILALREIEVPIVVPLHPRTLKTLGGELRCLGPQTRVIDPVPYLDMLMLESNARVILTDSGGVQKEAYWFGVPCVTLRDETEWVELVSCGCNRLAGADPVAIREAVRWAEQTVPQMSTGGAAGLYGDGSSAEAIVALLVQANESRAVSVV